MSQDRELRTLRDRQAWLDRAIGDGAGRKDFVVARKLVQVYDQGAIPTVGDKFFACHPVMLNGDECESCPGTTVVDTDTTIYVDFLRTAPQVGDIAVASQVGGRWVAELGGPGEIVKHKCGDFGCAINLDTITFSWSGEPCRPDFVCQPFPPATVFESPYPAGSTTLTWGGPSFLGFRSPPRVMPTCCPNDIYNAYWFTIELTCSGVWSLSLFNDSGPFPNQLDTNNAAVFTCNPLLIVWNDVELPFKGTLTISP